MAFSGYYYDDLIGGSGLGMTTTTGTVSAIDTNAIATRQMREMEEEMRRMARDADMERQRRKEMERMMYQAPPSTYTRYDMNGYKYNVAIDPGQIYPTAAPKNPHSCSAKTNERHRGYTEGLIEYHRGRGKVDVAKLEADCKEPDCLLKRITK